MIIIIIMKYTCTIDYDHFEASNSYSYALRDCLGFN